VGIEPFLIVGIVMLMFLVQVARAGHAAVTDRLEFSLLTMDGADEHATRRAMAPEGLPVPTRPLLPEAGPEIVPSLLRSWTSTRPGGLLVRLLASRRPGPVRRALHQATGVHQRAIGQHRKWLAPSILVVVQLPRDVLPGLRISPRPGVVPDAERVPLSNPVLDHVLRLACADPAAARAAIADPALHEPLIELMAMHPLSVVTGEAVALWCTRAVRDPEPLVHLAEEVARALLAVADKGR